MLLARGLGSGCFPQQQPLAQKASANSARQRQHQASSPCALRPHRSPTWWRWALRSILQLHLDRALRASAGSGVQRSQRHCPRASRALRRCRSLASSAETEVVLEAERHSLVGHAPARARTPHNPHGLARRAPVGRASSRRLRLRDVTGARSACTTTVPPAGLVGSLC